MARGTRRSTLNNKRRKGLRSIVVPWVKRFGVVIAVITIIGWCGAWFVLSDADTHTKDWFHDRTLEITASLGFEVEDILVKGRVHTDTEILMAILNTQKGDPLFALDPKSAREQIEKITWVEHAFVERRWPNTIHIRLQERVPMALLQKNKRLRLLDKNGEVIAAQNLKPFKNLVIVIGQGAPENAYELLKTASAEPEIFKRIEVASRISDRRWDLKMQNGTTIKLPENDLGLAIRRLADAQNNDGVLDKDIQSLDLRDPTRMIVRTKPGTVQEYKAGFSSQGEQTGNSI